MKYVKGHPEQSYGKDRHRFARCRFCGFINEVSKRPAGGEGDGYIIVQVNEYGGHPERFKQLVSVTNVSPERDFSIDVNNPPKKKIYEQKSVSGCHFCGSKNYY